MKTITMSMLALFCATVAFAQPPTIRITGHVTDVPDGTVIRLMKGAGNIFQSVATDTLRDGRFTLRTAVEATEELPVNLMLRDGGKDKTLQTRLFFWAAPGETAITGTGTDLESWKVLNDEPIQAEYADLLQIKRQYNARLAPVDRLLDSCYACRPRPAEFDSLRAERDKIYDLIYVDQLAYLSQKEGITRSGLNELSSIAQFGLKFRPGLEAHRNQIEALYNRLTDEQKASVPGQEIAAILHPRRTLGIGDRLPNDVLRDTSGVSHTLADYAGKYVLLDVWSCGCGPCIMAGDELRSLHERYADQLSIIGINVDDAVRWKMASTLQNITWTNLSDGLGQIAGFCSNFTITGIPHYILADPSGKIIDIWTGYDQGSLNNKIEPLFLPAD